MTNKGLIETLIEEKPINEKISIPSIYIVLIIIYKYIENFKGIFITKKQIIFLINLL